MRKHVFIAALIGVASALGLSALYLLLKPEGRNKDMESSLQFGAANRPPLPGTEHPEVMGVTREQGTASPRPDELVAEGPTPAVEAVVEGQAEPSVSNYERRIEFYLESFLGPQPDILGWNALFGELAMQAKLDRDALSTNAQGETLGVFKIPGTDKEINFEISAEGCTVIMKGEMSPSGIEHVGYRAAIGWKTRDGQIDASYGSVQFVARDGYEEAALDKRIVGYVYDVSDKQTLFRPMEASMHKGHYALFVPPPEKNERLDFGELRPAYNWNAILSDIDTPERVAQRTASSDGQR